jgi:hypothetical protein
MKYSALVTDWEEPDTIEFSLFTLRTLLSHVCGNALRVDDLWTKVKHPDHQILQTPHSQVEQTHHGWPGREAAHFGENSVPQLIYGGWLTWLRGLLRFRGHGEMYTRVESMKRETSTGGRNGFRRAWGGRGCGQSEVPSAAGTPTPRIPRITCSRAPVNKLVA